MQIKHRLNINTAIMALCFMAMMAVLLTTSFYVSRALQQMNVADELVTSQLEILALRADYLRSGSERAREQARAKNEKVSELLALAAKKFSNPEDGQTIAELAQGHQSIAHIFRTVVANRQRAAAREIDLELAGEVEDRLVSQLNIRVYEATILGGKLQAASYANFVSMLKTSGWLVISILLAAFVIIMINSLSVSRAIIGRIRALREGIRLVEEGDLQHRIGLQGGDEFAELSTAFDRMAIKLNDSYQRIQKEVDDRTRAEQRLLHQNSELCRINNAMAGRELRMLELKREVNEFAILSGNPPPYPLDGFGHVVDQDETMTEENQTAMPAARSRDMTVTAHDNGGDISPLALLNLMEDAIAARNAAHQVAADLFVSEERMRLAQQVARIGTFEWNIQANTFHWSQELKALYGMEPDGYISSVDDWAARLHPEDRARAERVVTNALATQKEDLVGEWRTIWPDGTIRWLSSRAKIDYDHAGNPLRMVGINIDVTDQKQVEEELRMAATVYRDSSEAMMVSDAAGVIIHINRAFMEITGYGEADAIGKTYEILRSSHVDGEFFADLQDNLQAAGRVKGEIWCRKKNGDLFAALLTMNTLYAEDGMPQRYVGLFSDITERKQSDEIIWNQANFDVLTGLPNRRFFRDRLQHEIRNARRSSMPLALMFLDLDGFKYVNDTLGHDMGDRLLREVADRLFGCVRETDTVARMGGDEFTIILPELQDPSNIERIARHILRVLSEPIRLGEERAYVSVSIGITLYPQDASDAEELIKNADQAMYSAKEDGKNRYHYFTPEMQEEALRRMRLINDMRGALQANQFDIVYQPIVELSSGSIHKAEALIRWQHPTKGLVSPIDFISAAEDTGMITSFGNWIFREAAKQASLWREAYHPAFQISLNISPVQFKNEGIDPIVWFEHLTSLGLPGQGVVVEITEGLLLEASTKVTDQLLMLRDAGIEVALDDFGTGYSSLSYLKKFDIDYIKIDQTFVSNLAPGSDDMTLCEAIIVMAHRLDIRVIAEGVETKRQHELLANSGCDFAQGYLFSKPVPAKEFEILLQTNPFAAQEVFDI